MVVEVELFGQLAPQLPRRQTVKIEETFTVSETAKMLGLDLDTLGLITINGVQCEEQDLVQPRCRLCFFAHMSGG